VLSRSQKKQKELPDSTGLLISILVRYPEVSSINYDPGRQRLKFTFIFARRFKKGELRELKQRVVDSIKAYNFLENKKIGSLYIKIRHQVFEHCTTLEVKRDVETLDHEEIALVVKLLREKFGGILVAESNEELFEEELVIQEELIDHMLENMKKVSGDKYLFAFRDEGKVMVFNK